MSKFNTHIDKNKVSCDSKVRCLYRSEEILPGVKRAHNNSRVLTGALKGSRELKFGKGFIIFFSAKMSFVKSFISVASSDIALNASENLKIKLLLPIALNRV